jgi:formylglycine-generating enzyme required for sulfatase activity
VLKKDGYADTRYPVLISRNQHWEGTVSLFTEEEIGGGFAHVPAGHFMQGGDPALPGWSLPASSPALEDYCIGVHPVTLEDYLEFLNSLAENDMDAALKVAPRWDMVSDSYLVRDEADRFKLPDIGFFGNDIHPRQPVQGISWYGGQAYCAWRSQRDGREYRLPTESEWEKSVRGVDGRSFPWGNRFDATLCNSPQSTQGRPGPLPVDDYPSDVSVYGVRGAAGNLRDWTGTTVKQGEGETALDASVIRGAAAEFAGTSDFTIMSRCAFRWVLPLFYINPGMSFRIAHLPVKRGI